MSMSVRRRSNVLLLAASIGSSGLASAAVCGDGVLDAETEECDFANASVAELCSDGCRVRCDTNVGTAATEHTCQHVSFGPFGAVAGNAYPGVVNSVISQTHVYFTVAMSRNEGNEVVDSAVNLFPIKSSAFALYLNEPEPVTVLDARGEPMPALLEAEVTTCSSGLSRVQVHTLDVDQSYLVVFPAAGAPSRSLVVEELGEHARFFSLDADADGFGQAQSALLTWCDLEGVEFVQDYRDCDDTRPNVFPGASELCDGLDNDCDGNPEDAAQVCEVPQPATDAGSLADSTSATSDARVSATEEPDGGLVGAATESVLLDGGETGPWAVSSVEVSAAPEVSTISSAPQTRDWEQTDTARSGNDSTSHAEGADAAVEQVSGTNARREGCGCTVVGARSRPDVWGAFSALVVLSCGLRRRVTGRRW